MRKFNLICKSIFCIIYATLVIVFMSLTTLIHVTFRRIFGWGPHSLIPRINNILSDSVFDFMDSIYREFGPKL